MVEELKITIDINDERSDESGGNTNVGAVSRGGVSGAAAGAAVAAGAIGRPVVSGKIPGGAGKPPIPFNLSQKDLDFLKNNPNISLVQAVKSGKIGAGTKVIGTTAGSINANNINAAGKLNQIKDFAKNPTSPLIGALSVVLTNPAVLAALAAYGIFSVALDQYFKDGAAGDRRLKLLIEEQIIASAERERLRELRKGTQTIRVSSAAGLRGRPGSVNSNLAEINRGNYFNIDINEADYKNVP